MRQRDIKVIVRSRLLSEYGIHGPPAIDVAAILAVLTAVANGAALDDPAVLTGFISGVGLILGKDASNTGVVAKPTEPTK